MTKTNTFAAAIVMVVGLSALPVHAQERPDFSGTWTLDSTRSESAAQGQPIGPVTVAIQQSGQEIRVQTDRDGKHETVTYPLDAAQEPPKAVGTAGSATSRWNGDVLQTESMRSINGKAVMVRESRHLDRAGREMIVETSVEIEHGYEGAGDKDQAKPYITFKDVFVKAQ